MEEEKKGVDLGASNNAAPETASVSETSADTITVETKKDGKKSRKTKPLNKKIIAVLILIVILVIGYREYKSNTDNFYKTLNSVGIKIANPNPAMTKTEAEAFINKNFMQGGTGATVTEVTSENGLFKIKLTVAGQEYTAYLTTDKKTFFPQAINVADLEKQKTDADAQAKAQEQQAQTDQAQSIANMTKNDKPQIQLFVMSHCPYGTQMEKGIIPVLKTLGDKVDFKLEFCDYSMHGDKELAEELNQYCISQNQPDKLISYLECFLADETSSAKCVTQVGIDNNKLSACVKATDDKYKITANAKDKSTYKSGTYPAFPIFQADVDKYKIEGSPNLAINGAVVTSARDSESLLKTVCSAFTTAPAECSKALDSTAPSAGFGYNAAASGASSSSSCGTQ